MNFDPRHRPFPVRLVNRIGTVFSRRFDAEELVRTARSRTGLDDFGAPEFDVPLRILVDAYEDEADLNFVGRLSARSYLLRLLENRLRLEADRRRHPGIGDEVIRAPLFVVGLPRSGTTILYNLLALDPANRAPLTWEVMLPSPPPRTETFATDLRIAKTNRLLRWVDRLAPEFKKIHPLDARLPQECIAITTHAFESIQFHTTHNVPSYQAWLDSRDLLAGYAWHRRFLQHLQWGTDVQRWLLKAPAHLFGFQALFETYPDARIIQTHRDPVNVVGSIASHGCVLRAAFSDVIDVHAIAAEWCEIWAQGLERAMGHRDEKGLADERVLDVHFVDFMHNPLGIIQRVYRHLGWTLEPNVEQSMRAFLAENPKDKHGMHRYSLDQFGLDAARVRARYAGYCDRFGVVLETPE